MRFSRAVDKRVVRAFDCQDKRYNSSRFQSQHPPTQWNLRDVRWRSVESCRNWERGREVSFLMGVHKSDFRYSAVYVSHIRCHTFSLELYRSTSKPSTQYGCVYWYCCIQFFWVHPQNVWFQNVRFQNIWFQNVWFQNVGFTKRQVYKTSGFKTSGFKTSSF
jgi:hypothetical protein